MRDGLWVAEKFTDNLQFLYKAKRVLYQGQTKFQTVDILELEAYGKTLFLDGKMQSAEIDEFVYHEALVHPAMLLHPEPKSVIILGGGEGATLREVLKHKTVKRAVMVDIDGELVDVCREKLPEWADGAFDDPRAELVIGDSRKYLEETDEKFDVVISDLTEPIEGGPSRFLFTKELYSRVYDVLTDDGIIVIQSGSADIYYHKFWVDIAATLKAVFPTVLPYHTYIFSFNLDWAFTLASKSERLELPSPEAIEKLMQERGLHDLKFLSPEQLGAMFALPVYLMSDFEKGGEILTDSRPFIWEA